MLLNQQQSHVRTEKLFQNEKLKDNLGYKDQNSIALAHEDHLVVQEGRKKTYSEQAGARRQLRINGL